MVVRILHILVVLALLGGTANSFSLQPHRSHHGWSSASVVIRRAKPRRADTGAVDTSVDDDDDEGEGCRLLLLDHLNINHERGRHDALKAFYFDFLGCGVDPRKYDNYLEGRKVSWNEIRHRRVVFFFSQFRLVARILEVRPCFDVFFIRLPNPVFVALRPIDVRS